MLVVDIMDYKKTLLSLFISFTFLISCSNAKRASEVTAIYVPASQYAGMTCDQLYNAAEDIRSRVPSLESAVDKARQEDVIKEQVGWWLFAPALLIMDGNADEQSQLANAKGQLEAIRTAAIRAECN
tara:strand:- start:2294 stop:2674 length:381 start_codon:yes stop_codon:yes gene_type:complete